MRERDVTTEIRADVMTALSVPTVPEVTGATAGTMEMVHHRHLLMRLLRQLPVKRNKPVQP